MSIVNITDITVLDNPSRFTDPYNLKITFECFAPLEDDLEWKLIYVGSSTSPDKDQELDSCMVGPIPIGTNSFVFTSPAPDPSQIPPSELVGVTVILLTASYQDKEFVRVGYYVNTEYEDPELRKLYADDATEEMVKQRPDPPVVAKLLRNVLAEKPRVTRFKIPWNAPLLPPSQPVQPATDPYQQPLPGGSGLAAATFQPAPMDYSASQAGPMAAAMGVPPTAAAFTAA